MLRLIKNRLAAITCMDNNPLNLAKISQKYHISKQLIMKDYFGFSETDEELPAVDHDQHVSKIDEIQHDLENCIKVINVPTTVAESSNAADETVPKALVALKFRIPMVFISKLAEYMVTHSRRPKIDTTDMIGMDDENQQQTRDLGLTNSDLLKKLIDLRQKLWENRQDLKKLSEIVAEESLNSTNNKKNDLVVENEKEIEDEVEEAVAELRDEVVTILTESDLTTIN